jgi:hypothetical protein
MNPNGLETGLREEMLQLNLEFLQLAARPGPATPAVGLSPLIRERLARLDHSRLLELARTPGLLAGFSGHPGEPELLGVADRAATFPAATADQPTVFFTFGLLNWLSQISRHSPLHAGLYAGVSGPLAQWLGASSFGERQRRAPRAARLLVARFAGHPRFWPDVVTALERNDADALAVARLCTLQLGLIGGTPAIAMRPPPCTMPPHAGTLDP